MDDESSSSDLYEQLAFWSIKIKTSKQYIQYDISQLLNQRKVTLQPITNCPKAKDIHETLCSSNSQYPFGAVRVIAKHLI